ncbi:hypothetical protein AHAS_Ahas07G0106600 [Arachis hypogaea]
MTMSLSKSDLLRPIVVVSISFLLCPIISMATLSTTLIASFSFFFELMFNNRLSSHMSGDDDVACYTNSLDARSKLLASLDSRREGIKYSGSIPNENLYTISKENLLMIS